MELVSNRDTLPPPSSCGFAAVLAGRTALSAILKVATPLLVNVKGVVEISEHDVFFTCKENAQRSPWRRQSRNAGDILQYAGLSSLAAPSF
jgi:hypothetical protein